MIEYQARGVVHVHVIIKYDGESPEQRGEVDERIWTDLPRRSIENGKLREEGLKYVVLKQCG